MDTHHAHLEPETHYKAKAIQHNETDEEAEVATPVADRPGTLDEVCTEIKTKASVKASAVFVFRAIANRFSAAVLQSIHAGASPVEMAAVKHEIDGLNISANDLASAIVIGTPAEKLP